VRDPDARNRLARIAPKVAPGPLAGERSLPVVAALAEVFPAGLTRGTTIACRGHAPMSSAFLAIAGAAQDGAWVGLAGVPALGLRACREAGVPLERLVAVREPATPFTDDTWGQVLAALIDGFDVILLGAASRVRAGTARRLQSRLQSRGAVLIVVGGPGAFSCDAQISSVAEWVGLGEGHGHLHSRRVELTVEGRRVPRPRRTSIWLPGTDGDVPAVPAVPVVDAVADVAPLRRTG
jgi:hypothetical protein